MYIKDILRATAYYKKADLGNLYDDLEKFIQENEGKIVKFVAKS